MKKTIKAIQAFLIHQLGGVTIEESIESDYNSWN